MNQNYIKYEAINAPTYDMIARELNYIKQWCRDIIVIHSGVGINELQIPVVAMLIKIDFKSDLALKEYEDYKNKKLKPLTV